MRCMSCCPTHVRLCWWLVGDGNIVVLYTHIDWLMDTHNVQGCRVHLTCVPCDSCCCCGDMYAASCCVCCNVSVTVVVLCMLCSTVCLNMQLCVLSL